MASCCLLVVCLLGQVAAPSQVPAAVPLDTTQRLDAMLAEFHKANGLVASPPADDATFLRRAWIDLAGRTPTIDEVRKFIASEQPAASQAQADKRAALIDRLLATQEAANHWGRVWTEYLTDRRPFEGESYNLRLLQNFLRDAWLADKDYRAIVRELLAGEGSSDTSGPANFLLRYNVQPTPLAGAVSKKFLGLTMQCAECHDHPFTGWKRNDFWGLSAYFARLRRMQPVDEPEGDNYFLVVERGRGELRMPDLEAPVNKDGNRPQKTVYPQLPGGKIADDGAGRREALSAWVTAEDNPYFARHYVNRTWDRLFGKPLVASFELPLPGDNASTVKATILDLLAKDFAASGCDPKQPLRAILRSQAYQRSAGLPGGATAAEGQSESLAREFLARFPVRPLTADETFLSIAQATGYRGDFQDAEISKLTREDFGYDQATPAFSAQPLSITRSLSLLNGEHVRGASDMAATATQRLFGNTPTTRHIEWIFLATLGRSPRPEEARGLLKLAAEGESAAGLQDVAWSLLNSAEFNTNH